MTRSGQRTWRMCQNVLTSHWSRKVKMTYQKEPKLIQTTWETRWTHQQHHGPSRMSGRSWRSCAEHQNTLENGQSKEAKQTHLEGLEASQWTQAAKWTHKVGVCYDLSLFSHCYHLSFSSSFLPFLQNAFPLNAASLLTCCICTIILFSLTIWMSISFMRKSYAAFLHFYRTTNIPLFPSLVIVLWTLPGLCAGSPSI